MDSAVGYGLALRVRRALDDDVTVPARPSPWRRPTLSMAAVTVGAVILVGSATAFGPVAGLSAVLAVPAVLVLVHRPVVGALVLAAFVPVLAGLQRGVPVAGFRLSELLLLGVSGTLLLTADQRRIPRWRLFDWLALAYVVTWAAMGALNVLLRGEQFDAEALGIMFGPFQFFLLYRAILVTLTGSAARSRAVRLMLLASIPVASVAILQRLGVGPFPSLMVDLTGPVPIDPGKPPAELGMRATGPFPHWHVLAAYTFAIMVVGVSLLLEGSGRVLSQRPLLLVLGLNALAMLASGTFTTVLAFLAGSVVLAAWFRRFKTILVGGALVAVVGVLLFGPLIGGRIDEQFDAPPGASRSAFVPQTVDYRIELWRNEYVPALADYVWRGYGPKHPPNSPFPYTESMYLTVILRGGLPLLAVYAALLYAWLGLAWRQSRAGEPEQVALARALVIIVAALIPMQAVEPYFTFGGFGHLLWALAALAVAPSLTNRPSPDS